MAAAPFDGTLRLAAVPGGPIVQSEVYDASDVDAEYATFKSWGGASFFHVRQDCYITDVVLTAAGTDTNRQSLYVNGKDVGITLFNAGLVSTVNNRLPTPIGPIKAGSTIQLKQGA